MKFCLEITMDNAAFEESEREVSRILKELASRLDSGDYPLNLGVVFYLRDVNGNLLGQAEIKGD
jgi:hypothetical protein